MRSNASFTKYNPTSKKMEESLSSMRTMALFGPMLSRITAILAQTFPKDCQSHRLEFGGNSPAVLANA